MKIVFALLVLLFACQEQPKKNSSANLERGLDSLIQTYLDSSKIAGVAVAVFKGNEKILLKSYGFADLEFDVKLPIDASFAIGSVTKQFTAVATLQLVEQGKLSLDDHINKYILFDTKGKNVTIRQLLGHTSGIKNYSELPIQGKIIVQKLQRDTLLRIIEDMPFDFEPGEQLIYNNTGYFMLGHIIEKIAGLTYEAYVAKNLFEKAGMTNSYYCSENRITKNRAHGYQMSDVGLIRAEHPNHTWPYGAGSLCSTVQDLVKWNYALHNGKMLGDFAYKQFVAPTKLNDGTTARYACGVAVAEWHEQRMVVHRGTIVGYRSENRYFPKDKLSIIILMNTQGPLSPTKFGDFITNYFYPLKERHPVLFNGDISKLAGTYEGSGGTTYVRENGGSLSVSSNDGKPELLSFLRDSIWTDNALSLYQFKKVNESKYELRLDRLYWYNSLKRVDTKE